MIVFCVFSYSQRRDGQRFIVGALACLLISGFLREAEFFFGSTTGSNMFYLGLIGLADRVCNVIMPLYAVFCIARGSSPLALGGFMDRFCIGDDWMTLFLTGGACLAVSGIVRCSNSSLSTAMEWQGFDNGAPHQPDLPQPAHERPLPRLAGGGSVRHHVHRNYLPACVPICVPQGDGPKIQPNWFMFL